MNLFFFFYYICPKNDFLLSFFLFFFSNKQMTNGQSRTAIAIMPPLFIFAVTSEQKLTHRMHEVAEVNEHNIQVCFVLFYYLLSAYLLLLPAVLLSKKYGATCVYNLDFLFLKNCTFFVFKYIDDCMGGKEKNSLQR
jgi:hypothetical protein